MKDRRLWIIFFIIFVNFLGFGIILPLLPYYVESLGAGALAIGLLLSTYSLFQLLSAPILGELSDRFGRRPVLLFSLGGTVISFALMGFANTLFLLFLARIIDGASGGNISTAQAYIADITNKKSRTQGMGMMMAAISLGFILGPAIGGLLSVYGYSVPAFVAAAVALIAMILTYFFLPESFRPVVRTAAQTAAARRKRIFRLKDFYDALTHPNIGLFSTISFMMMLAFSLMQGTFALFTEHTLHFTAETNGLIFAYLGIVGVLVQILLLPKILKKIPENLVIIFSLTSMALSLFIIAFASSMSALIVAVTFLALGNGVSGPVIAGTISKPTPDDEQGNIAGMNQSVGSMARLTGPLIGTFLYSQLGVRSPYLIATGILLLTVLYTARKLKKTHSRSGQFFARANLKTK